MKRLLMTDLIAWQQQIQRKPLILQGARQVGKTYLLEQFGRDHFNATHYFNFEKQAHLTDAFVGDLDPKHILQQLSLLQDRAIDAHQDLIIFDEIQACPNALTSLKYFCEEMPNSFICGAGSLLGLHLADTSYPVGKTQKLTLAPMNFIEFLQALDKQLLVDQLMQLTPTRTISPIAHQQLWQLLKCYFITGGLPEVVKLYCKQQDNLLHACQTVRARQHDLIEDYLADIAKHAGKINAMHINRIWHSVPEQLARTQDGGSKKFKFKGVVPGIDRFDKLAGAIDWLEAAGLILKVHIAHHAELPLAAYAPQNAFKLFMFDVGILGAMSQLSPQSILDYQYGSYKGFFAENYIAQAFIAANPKQALYAWQAKNGISEIEFLQVFGQDIIPIEVKAGHVTQAKSLQVFADKYHPAYRVIMSAKPFSIDNNRHKHYYPLYLASRLPLQDLSIT